MRFFALRRFRNVAFLALFFILSLIAYTAYSQSLRRPDFLTGWVLLLVVAALALYNVRKKLPFLPLLSSSTWLQFHIYAGVFAFLTFLVHTGFELPEGGLEVTVALLFLTVSASGVVGLFFSRSIPRRLTTRGEEVIFERIPGFIGVLRGELDDLVTGSGTDTSSVAIGGYYTRRLIPFFDGPRHFWRHLAQSERAGGDLLAELYGLHRYVDREERSVLEEIESLIVMKDDLDYHYAHQAVLKYWLFVHVPLTCSLLIVIVVHVIAVFAFAGTT